MSEVNNAYASVKDLSTPSDTSNVSDDVDTYLTDRSIRCVVHFIHLDMSDGVDKSWTEA
jgi:hypothetical protein